MAGRGVASSLRGILLAAKVIWKGCASLSPHLVEYPEEAGGGFHNVAKSKGSTSTLSGSNDPSKLSLHSCSTGLLPPIFSLCSPFSISYLNWL